MQDSSKQNGNAFKRAQVRYRRQGTAPNRLDDLDELIDFSSKEDGRITGPHILRRLATAEMTNHGNNTTNQRSTSLDHYYHGPLFSLNDAPDFLYAPQALSPELQEQLSYAAVTTYCEAPHKTNIDAVPRKPQEEHHDTSMWELWKEQHNEEWKNPENCNNKSSHHNHNQNQKKYYKSFQKLSWATTGYHYDWTQRSYDKAAYSPMPPLLHQVSTLLARTALLYYQEKDEDDKETSMAQQQKSDEPSTAASEHDKETQVSGTSLSVEDGPRSSSPSSSLQQQQQQFTPSACIVNYYNPKSLMGGHRDDLELALDKPIVSASLGRPAVFLLGGTTKDETPVRPILVRPGDVCFLGGACRLAFHGMARLLPHNLPPPCAVVAPSRQISVDTLQLLHKSQQEQQSAGTQMADNNNNNATQPPGKESPGLGVRSISEEERAALQVYLSQHRININVRQVYPDGENHVET